MAKLYLVPIMALHSTLDLRAIEVSYMLSLVLFHKSTTEEAN